MPSMPADAPERLDGPAAWTGAEIAAAPERWSETLEPDAVAELEAAAAHFRCLGKDVGEIEAAEFPLPSMAPRLAELRHALIFGAGVRVLRGLPVRDYDRWTAAAIFCGIGAHLGKARSQNGEGHILGHVRDVGKSSADPNARIYQTAERQTFHTDSADAVGLLCLQDAREGGDSLLASAETIYNLMRAERPDLLACLFDPIATDRQGEAPEGAKPFMEIPPFSWHDGKLTVFYQRQYIDSAQRFPEAMRLTDAHVAALEMFDALADDPEVRFVMRLRPGDMQFVYNHAMLHDRTAFADRDDPARKRHLLRLWLSLPGDRALPECFRQRYGSIEIGDRGGIDAPATGPTAPLD